MIFGVDFDGTCVYDEFPKNGKDNELAVQVLKELVSKGHDIILYTVRSGNYLHSAVDWFSQNNIPLYGINVNPAQSTWSTSHKPFCHYYIDDRNFGAPVFLDKNNHKTVDWKSIRELLVKEHIL